MRSLQITMVVHVRLFTSDLYGINCSGEINGDWISECHTKYIKNL